MNLQPVSHKSSAIPLDHGRLHSLFTLSHQHSPNVTQSHQINIWHQKNFKTFKTWWRQFWGKAGPHWRELTWYWHYLSPCSRRLQASSPLWNLLSQIIMHSRQTFQTWRQLMPSLHQVYDNLRQFVPGMPSFFCTSPLITTSLQIWRELSTKHPQTTVIIAHFRMWRVHGN